MRRLFARRGFGEQVTTDVEDDRPADDPLDRRPADPRSQASVFKLAFESLNLPRGEVVRGQTFVGEILGARARSSTATALFALSVLAPSLANALVNGDWRTRSSHCDVESYVAWKSV